MKMSILTVTIFAIFVSMNEARVLTKTENSVKTSEKSDSKEVAVVTQSEVRTKVNEAIVNKMKDSESNPSDDNTSPQASHQSISQKETVKVDNLPKNDVVIETTVHNTSEESSLKTDSSMKDYDINQTEIQAQKSHNSDVIEEVVLKTNSQVLDEKNSEVEANTAEKKSEGLKITSAFVGIATLIALF